MEHKKRARSAQSRRRAAYPSAGPVTVTKADGTVEIHAAEKGGDQPFKKRLVGKWTGADTVHSTVT